MEQKNIHLLLPVNILVRNGFAWCLELLEEGQLYQESTRSPAHVTCMACKTNFAKAAEDDLHPLRDYILLANLQRSLVMKSPEIVARYCRSMAREEQIVLKCLALTSRQRFICSKVLALGTLTGILTHPREIFHFVLAQNAFGFILVQNEPSGESEPSEEACKLTKKMVECSKLMQIEFYDHIIVALDGYYSFRERTTLWT